jgi:hypothetical protein
MDDVAFEPARHKLNVDDYHRMADAGIFAEADRIEPVPGVPSCGRRTRFAWTG